MHRNIPVDLREHHGMRTRNVEIASRCVIRRSDYLRRVLRRPGTERGYGKGAATIGTDFSKHQKHHLCSQQRFQCKRNEHSREAHHVKPRNAIAAACIVLLWHKDIVSDSIDQTAANPTSCRRVNRKRTFRYRLVPSEI